MKRTSKRDAGAVAGGDDQAAEDEEGEHLEDRADVLAEDDEVVGDVVLGDAEGDPADEGGDQPVAEGDVGEPEGEHPDPERVDPLVAADDPAARQVLGEPAGAPAQGDPDHSADRGLAEQLQPLLRRRHPGRRG